MIPLPTPLSHLPSVVGRITGMVDCKWEKKGSGIGDWGLEKGSGLRVQGTGTENHQSSAFQSLIPNPQSLVSLGDQFALASGLVEITYDTGAKVILQGPVTYSVETNGGYLTIGKLTGKLENRGERRGERGEGDKSEIRNLKSEISAPSPLSPLLSPLFIIRTPTATVTDLGTEFGVEVSGCDSTKVCVFVGEVQVETAHRKSSRLMARQAVQIATGGVQPVPSSGMAERFVRTLRSPVEANGSFSDNFVEKPSRHWINPQAASYVGGRALFDYGREDADRVYLYTAGDCNYAAHDFVATVKITNAAGHAGMRLFRPR